MTTISPQAPAARPDRHARIRRLAVPEMWAALAISVMWLAVLFDAVFGPNIISTNSASTASVPSCVVLAPFAFLGTWVVARRGFGRRDEDD